MSPVMMKWNESPSVSNATDRVMDRLTMGIAAYSRFNLLPFCLLMPFSAPGRHGTPVVEILHELGGTFQREVSLT